MLALLLFKKDMFPIPSLISAMPAEEESCEETQQISPGKQWCSKQWHFHSGSDSPLKAKHEEGLWQSAVIKAVFSNQVIKGFTLY